MKGISVTYIHPQGMPSVTRTSCCRLFARTVLPQQNFLSIFFFLDIYLFTLKLKSPHITPTLLELLVCC